MRRCANRGNIRQRVARLSSSIWQPDPDSCIRRNGFFRGSQAEISQSKQTPENGHSQGDRPENAAGFAPLPAAIVQLRLDGRPVFSRVSGAEPVAIGNWGIERASRKPGSPIERRRIAATAAAANPFADVRLDDDVRVHPEGERFACPGQDAGSPTRRYASEHWQRECANCFGFDCASDRTLVAHRVALQEIGHCAQETTPARTRVRRIFLNFDLYFRTF